MAALGTHPDQIPISLLSINKKLKVKVKTNQIKKVKVKTHPCQIHTSLLNQEKTKSESENKSNKKSVCENTSIPNTHQSCQLRITLKKAKTNQINVLCLNDAILHSL